MESVAERAIGVEAKIAVAYNSAMAAVEMCCAIQDAVDAKVLEAIAVDGWVTSQRSRGSIDVTGDVDCHYAMTVLHLAAVALHVKAVESAGSVIERVCSVHE